MLIQLEAQKRLDKHVQVREGMTDYFNKELEKIMNANQHREVYWILGKVRKS